MKFHFFIAIYLAFAGGVVRAEQWVKHTIQKRTLGGINSALANDWNQDGHIDVISCFGKQVYLFAGPDWNRTSVFSLSEATSRNKLRAGCIHSCLMDVDGDGDQDFIGSSNTVFWLECPDDPFADQWTYRIVDDEILGTHCLITGDVNMDGKTDLIANSGRNKGTEFPNSIAWLEVPKEPHTAPAWTRHIFAKEDAPGGSHYTGIADMNGDGRPDIACGAKGGEKFEGGNWFAWWEQPEDPTQVWKKKVLSDKEPGASNIMPADFDGDGKMDYFATRGHGIGTLLFRNSEQFAGSGDNKVRGYPKEDVFPHFQQIEVDKEIIAPHSLDLADLDTDGDIDAVTCGKEADGIAAWYENDGKANFTKHIIGINQGSYDTRSIDMDKDGDLDILIAGHASNNIVWYENRLKP